ncbi:hypothetical protein D043_0453B, partial [Vibrio parahaemolyticus EKP-021]
QRVAV